jgi:hypothetical protein
VLQQGLQVPLQQLVQQLMHMVCWQLLLLHRLGQCSNAGGACVGTQVAVSTPELWRLVTVVRAGSGSGPAWAWQAQCALRYTRVHRTDQLHTPPRHVATCVSHPNRAHRCNRAAGGHRQHTRLPHLPPARLASSRSSIGLSPAPHHPLQHCRQCPTVLKPVCNV